MEYRDHITSSCIHTVRAAVLAACGFTLLISCASNPTGGVDFVTMSENREIEIGREMHEEILQQQPVYQDPQMQAYVERVGQRLAAASHRPDIEYHFTIIDSPEINAFALPGGYIYINRGLMAYLNSEDQLAAVLGHEIGHVTARHSVRQRAASQTNSVIATVLAVGTGVGSLGETSSLLGGALISGYGRDMELESDGLGAEYLAGAGYDPEAMVEVIGVLKNHEDFTKLTSSGATSYHGVFATHPRNDTRLQQVVGRASELSATTTEYPADPAEFRQRMSGLSLGASSQMPGSQARNRYYQNLLNYTLVFPNEWSWDETPTTLSSNSPDDALSMGVRVQRIEEFKPLREYVQEDLGLGILHQGEELQQFGLLGYTGISPGDNSRIAVFYYGPRAYILTGRDAAGAISEENDQILLEIVQSFRPITPNERSIANPPHLEYIQSDGRTYAQLAAENPFDEYAEDLLRLYNGDYPRGEPTAGEWIKVVR